VRMALAMAQGWQLATGINLLGIGSVEALAARARAEQMFGRITLVVDAQRDEFYQAIFEVTPDRLVEIEPLKIVTAATVDARACAGELIAGPEVTRWFPTGKNLFPSAAMLVMLAEHRNDFCHGKQLEPIYLREASFLKIPAQMKH
ncbi:MAG TPA: hypothetical protein VMJ12_12610, partial [Candidatus Acidoferrales bacterium]|nr:hypothetical protein [Candidatus Acidoferrales bacterium]